MFDLGARLRALFVSAKPTPAKHVDEARGSSRSRLSEKNKKRLNTLPVGGTCSFSVEGLSNEQRAAFGVRVRQYAFQKRGAGTVRTRLTKDKKSFTVTRVK